MQWVFILGLLFLPPSVLAAELPCSVRPAKDTPAADLPSLAKVSMDDAEKAALAKIKARRKQVVDRELETERGCLVYSFDIKISGKPGVEEILVDAGTGKIISYRHESPKQEAAEQAKEKAPSK